MIEGGVKAGANPTKQFFVRMITRDIALEDCIMDLIDNSVDGAWRSEGDAPRGLSGGASLSKYTISIDLSPECFSISDDCGGMTLDDAVEHAFSFGRPTADRNDDYSIGVYGIGMKRAVFKLGNDVVIRSTYLNAEGTPEAFSVPIDVEGWLENDVPPWDFDIVADAPLERTGVAITVKGLSSGTSQSFGSQAFVENLRRMIGRDYTLHLNRGLTVKVNGLPVAGWSIELRESADIAPMRLAYEDEIAGEQVAVEVIGGMAAPPPEALEPDEEDEGDKRFGWYVVCNGRIVLAADKTTVAGWGTDGWPQWHSQYSGFLGIVIFTAARAVALPLTTTKRSVDTSSEIYRRARVRMRDVTRKWVDYTNARRNAIEDARRVEAAALPISIQSVSALPTVRLPTYLPRPPAERMANVNYAVPVSRLKKVAQKLGSINMTYRDVGTKTFDYYYDDVFGDD